MGQVQHGTIIKDQIADIVQATEIKRRLVNEDNNFSYEITGVHGNYKIIKRELESTESNYVNSRN